MGKKKDHGNAVNLDSFLDILTCLQGVLMLVIISTGIDAAQTKVLIPTPIERQSTKAATYIECRGNLVYPMDVAALAREARTKMTRLVQDSGGDQLKMVQGLTQTRVTNDYYEVDLSYYLLGQLVIKPKPAEETSGQGYELEERSTFATDNFMVRTLKSLDPEKDRIVLIVRDDSFNVFKVAQRLSFLAKMELMVEIYDVREPLRFNQQAVLVTGT